MTQQELLSRINTIINEWRNILRLELWEIEVEVVHPRVIPDMEATITFNSYNRFAIVRITDPEIQANDNLEKTIVHELLHLVWAGAEEAWRNVTRELSPSAKNIADRQWELETEQSIEQLAKVLFSLKGGDKDRSIRD